MLQGSQRTLVTRLAPLHQGLSVAEVGGGAMSTVLCRDPVSNVLSVCCFFVIDILMKRYIGTEIIALRSAVGNTILSVSSTF